MPSVSMPLFPLAAPALFPHCVAPLHVFEPRYRALTADALAGERRIGMATVRPEAIAKMAGDPALFAIGCAGFIAEHQRLPDGRYLILLSATTRFRILEEPARPRERLYRVASVELLEEAAGDGARAAEQRACVVRELRVLAATSGTDASFDAERLDALDDGRFACEVAQALRLPGPEKQALLEAPTAADRLDGLAQTLAFYRASGPNRGDATLH
ncbi:MAG TPA: LON peptidase substrate-binding domain-containing protein [Myxococcota bacterium]